MANRNVLHLICQAHLDPVWLWPWRDGCAEAHTTMQSAVDRLREYPELRFSRSSAITYRWVQEMDPRLFAEILTRVQEGRWEVVNGWIEQPDCNLPSTESFARQSLYGKRYFARELGVDVPVGYNVDSFGHAGGLPQLLTQAGFRYYVFMRPSPEEYGAPLPMLFWWESPDGARVLTFRIPTGYCQGTACSPETMESLIRHAVTACFPPGLDHGALFVGLGNHGGGPTKIQLDRIIALREDESLPELRFSTLAEFFAAVEASPAAVDIPVVRGELQHHATGCYAAMGEIKARNRRAERFLVEAETLSVLTGLADARPYPADTLREAWWTLLFNQFHDILAGSSVAPACANAIDALGGVCQTAERITVGAAQTIARRIDTTGAPEGVLVLVNSLPWARKALVQCDTYVAPHRSSPITHLATPDGETLPLQWLPAEYYSRDGDWKKLTALVDLPPCGYRAFHLAHGEPPAVPTWQPKALVTEGTPGVASLPTVAGTNVLAAPLGFVVIRDTSDTWGHGVYAYREELGRPSLVSTRVIADGPVCRVVRQQLHWQASQIIMDVYSYREQNIMELRLRVNWQEKRQSLKLEIPTALTNVQIQAKTAGGVTQRAANGHEEPMQDWVALEGRLAGKPYALALINAGSYSYDALDGLLRAVVTRAVPFAEHDPHKLPDDTDAPFLDQGWQERRFWIAHTTGCYRDLALPRLADAVQTPAQWVLDSAHPGDAPWEASWLSIDAANAHITAIKEAESGEGLVIRLLELHGISGVAHLRIPALGIEHAEPLAPWELKTLHVNTRQHPPQITCCSILEEEM